MPFPRWVEEPHNSLMQSEVEQSQFPFRIQSHWNCVGIRKRKDGFLCGQWRSVTASNSKASIPAYIHFNSKRFKLSGFGQRPCPARGCSRWVCNLPVQQLFSVKPAEHKVVSRLISVVQRLSLPNCSFLRCYDPLKGFQMNPRVPSWWCSVSKNKKPWSSYTVKIEAVVHAS